MQRATRKMIYNSVVKQGFFEKNRYIGVVGRQALHIFDLNLMKFVFSDVLLGYGALYKWGDQNLL